MTIELPISAQDVAELVSPAALRSGDELMDVAFAVDVARPALRPVVVDDVVAPGVTADDLARIAALAGFPSRPTTSSPGAAPMVPSLLAADDHPALVGAQLAASAATVRAFAWLLAILAVGVVAGLLV